MAIDSKEDALIALEKIGRTCGAALEALQDEQHV